MVDGRGPEVSTLELNFPIYLFADWEGCSYTLHIEAAHEGFEDWYDGEDQTLQPDVKIINKCIQVLIEMPTEASQYVKDRSTTKDMISFTEMFKHATAEQNTVTS